MAIYDILDIGMGGELTKSSLSTSVPCLINSSATSLLLFIADQWSGVYPSLIIWMRFILTSCHDNTIRSRHESAIYQRLE